MVYFSKIKFRVGRKLTDYSKVQWLISCVHRNNRFFCPAIADGAYFNVGCGPNVKPGFINVDYDWRPGIDICCDITRSLPAADAQLGGIFTEHCLEHLSLAGAACRRRHRRRRSPHRTASALLDRINAVAAAAGLARRYGSTR